MDHLDGSVDAALAADENDPPPVPQLHSREIATAQAHAAQDINLEETSPVLIGNFLKRLRFKDAEVIDQNVNIGKLGEERLGRDLGREVAGSSAYYSVSIGCTPSGSTGECGRKRRFLADEGNLELVVPFEILCGEGLAFGFRDEDLHIGSPIVLFDFGEDFLQFGNGADLGREPSLAAESLREEVVVQLGQIVVAVATLADHILDAVDIVVQDEDHGLDAVAAHHAEFIERELV